MVVCAPCDWFFDLVDFWVIKIKILWSFAHVLRRDHVNRARNADQAARVCYRFVYSIVKITRVWLSNVEGTRLEKFTRYAKVYGLFLLDCAFWMLTGWAGKLRSRGFISKNHNIQLLKRDALVGQFNKTNLLAPRGPVCHTPLRQTPRPGPRGHFLECTLSCFWIDLCHRFQNTVYRKRYT